MTNLQPIKAPCLETRNLRHGFFTRKGGVSGGIYGSLNCGIGSNDSYDSIRENRARVARHLQLLESHLLTAYQKHSTKVVTVQKIWAVNFPPSADALVTKRRDIGLGIITADCAPVLLADTSTGVIGAAHAGWRGAVDGVLKEVVIAMEKLGANRSQIVAAIGPCINKMSYEVGPEFRRLFVDLDRDNVDYFVPAEKPEHSFFDLPGYLYKYLTKLNLGAVQGLNRNTYSESDVFYSYRRAVHSEEPDYGRQLSVIALT